MTLVVEKTTPSVTGVLGKVSGSSIPRFERSMNWEFLGNQNDCGAAAAGAAAVVPGGVAEQLPGSRSPLSNELGSLLGKFHWKNSKTEGIQENRGILSFRMIF